ncbi:chemotaxis protein CheW [Altericista sp. CCNU0014]|uniref:chemotaxis protein CheW n=1 Tax=Altericista sp. CCNU0014 TaxID=3082949 RepID=UPI00384F8AA7
MKLPILDAQTLQQKAVGDPYLKVQLTLEQFAVLPMAQAQEAIAIPPSRVTPVPNMPACVLGLLNQKSRVIWVVNLAQLLGLESQSLNVQQYNLAIIRSGKTPLGLVVPEIRGVVRLVTEAMQPMLGEILPELTPYLRGGLIHERETLWVLDVDAIVRSPVLAGNR